MPVSTNSPTPAPTAAAVPESASLDDYLARLDCASFESQQEAATSGDFSAPFTEIVERMSVLAPPPEIAAWHQARLDGLQAIKTSIDQQTQDGKRGVVLDFDTLEEYTQRETEAVAQMSDVTRRRLADAGCFGSQPASDDDDHGNHPYSATAVAVGTGTQGAIDYEDDVDFFGFTAEAGELYQIDVALGTLDEFWLDIYDSDTQHLDGDHGDSLASRIVWEAPNSGDYYVEVEGWFGSTGSYTLTIFTNQDVPESAEDIAALARTAVASTPEDDHGNDTDSATTVTVGADIQGFLDYLNDLDYFRFTATGGVVYQIDVILGTLENSEVILFGSNGWDLAYNDDHGDSLASRIVWEAPDSGDYYVHVEASGLGGTGSYTLNISLSDTQDDHGNDTDSATPIAVGADIQGAIEYENDVDYFRFTAEADRLYQIDAVPGTLVDSAFTLFDSAGHILMRQQSSSSTWTAPNSGNYYVRVSKGPWSDRDDTGTYTLTVTLP